MLLSDLIADMDVREVHGTSNVEVSGIAYSAKGVSDGYCFVAMKGTQSDGHDFARDAIKNGAKVVVSERSIDFGGDATNVVVDSSRFALGIMSSRMYGDPSSGMRLIGITGTNGKTTTTYLVESIMRCAGMNPGVIGTVEYRYNGKSLPAPHTTPQSLDLQKLLSNMRDAGCDCCTMEVSSHALAQDRVAGCRYDVGVFTNLTPEHLDYHENMESYFDAKAKMFEFVLESGGKSGATAVINVDDSYGEKLRERSTVPVITFGMDRPADIRGTHVVSNADGIKMRLETPKGSTDISTRLCGSFNAQNILAATATAYSIGVDLDRIREGIESLEAVPGRFEAVANSKGILALVDYSHTPDALTKALTHAKELAAEGRLIAVFGCGGDRDRAKRPLMGKAAACIADIAIVTSDNPRTEDPDTIIDEILPGVEEAMEPLVDEGGYEVIADRMEAITHAVELAGKGDVIVVAGKGHEDYQILGTEKIHFDDREVLAEAMNG